jgi:hypothetical protein
LTEDEMLAELTWRYFNSHGPALVADCAWWSGLPNRMLARGLELNRHRLHSEVMDGVGTYWFADGSAPPVPEDVYLLPNYDEYTVAYRHRDLYYDAKRNWTGDARADVPFVNVILLRGQVAGRWKRTAAGIDGIWTIEPSDTERAALAEAKERYARFLAS